MSRPAREGAPDLERPLGPEVRHVDPSASPDDVLVFNSRGGVYQGHLSSSSAELSSERQQRIEIQTLRLYPGLNFVNRTLFGKLADQPGLAERLARSEIVEIRDFGAISPKLATDYIKHSADVPTLKRLLEVEKREAIAAEIGRHIRLAETDAPPPDSHPHRAQA